MTVERLAILFTLIAFLLAGGVTGHTRMGVCFDGVQPEPQQTVVKTCCDASSHHTRGSSKSHAAGHDDSHDCSLDCISCAVAPLTTDGYVPQTRDLKHHSEAPFHVFLAIPTILLPTLVTSPPAADALERCPLFTPTHESVPVTVLRC